MKDLAKHMRRARVAPRKPRKPVTNQKRDEVPASSAERPQVPKGLAGEVPDTWDPKYRPDIEAKARQARKELKEKERKELSERLSPEEPNPVGDGYELVERARIHRKKRRTSQISICVSEEEEAIIRAYVADRDQSISAWMRGLAFKAMGRKIPARPKRR